VGTFDCKNIHLRHPRTVAMYNVDLRRLVIKVNSVMEDVMNVLN